MRSNTLGRESFPNQRRRQCGKNVFWNMIFIGKRVQHIRTRNEHRSERKYSTHRCRMWHICIYSRNESLMHGVRRNHVDWIYLFMKNLLPFRDLIWIWILIRNIDFHFGLSECIRFLSKHLVYDESGCLLVTSTVTI